MSPLINPPNEYGPSPSIIEDHPISDNSKDEWIKQRLIEGERTKWLCPDCGITNFGFNQKCANWKCKRPKQ